LAVGQFVGLSVMVVSPAKTDRDAVWDLGPRKHCIRWGLHTGATWRMPLNCPCAAAMRMLSNYFDHLLSLLPDFHSLLIDAGIFLS